MISTFIVQRYLDLDYHANDVPQLIVTGMPLDEADGLADVLREKANHTVTRAVGRRGIRKKWLDMAESSAMESVTVKTLSQARLEAQFEALAKWLDLPVLPGRVECIDISHTLGEETV